MSELERYVETKGDDVGTMLANIKNRVGQILPGKIGPDRVLQTMAHCIRINPQLMQCSRDSLLAALLQSARDGLELGSEAVLVPRSSKGKLQVVYQRTYTGDLTLARRSGEYAAINCGIAYENDQIKVIQGTKNELEIIPNFRDRGQPVLFWCSYSLKDGGDAFDYMTIEEATKHMNNFAPKNRNGEVVGPWVDHFESMALKTIIKKTLKYGPKAFDIQAQAADERVLTMDVGDLPTPVEELPPAIDMEPEPEPEEKPKKRRGRPKGAKNKPKGEAGSKRPAAEEKPAETPADKGKMAVPEIFSATEETQHIVDMNIEDLTKATKAEVIRDWIRANGPAALIPDVGEKAALALHEYAYSCISNIEGKQNGKEPTNT